MSKTQERFIKTEQFQETEPLFLRNLMGSR